VCAVVKKRILGKLKDIFVSRAVPLPEGKRTFAVLPREGEVISVETALNSRCNSDYGGRQIDFHWGIFDRTRKLSEEQIKLVTDVARIPRFTNETVEVRRQANILMFTVAANTGRILRDYMMVESGMQQQAVGLVCAALGIGLLFNNLGPDGTPLSKTEFGTVRILLDAMNPSYANSFWSDSVPANRKPWLPGNLKEPDRKGSTPLLHALCALETSNHGSRRLSEEAISQLFWAARGRTPHLYKSKPWGMTIPFWTDRFEITNVYLISEGKLFKYVNWDKGRPTHRLAKLTAIDQKSFGRLAQSFPSTEQFIVVGKNDPYNRALWEVGYQLLNLLVQAKVLDLRYQAILLDGSHKDLFDGLPILDPIAVLALQDVS